MEKKYTPGPWSVDKLGNVTGEHHPIADVTSGKWGDNYPTIVLEGLSLERRAVPVMDMIVYGEIDKEEARANAQLIASAPDMVEMLQDILDAQEAGEQYDNYRIRELIAKAIITELNKEEQG